jgi:hypothetical protein
MSAEPAAKNSTRWKAPSFHGARQLRTRRSRFAAVAPRAENAVAKTDGESGYTGPQLSRHPEDALENADD